MSFGWGKFIGYYARVGIQSLIVFFIVMLFLALIYNIWLIKDDQPVAVLKQEGIWIMRHGFISWQDIQEVAIYKNPGISIKSIGIRLKYPAKIAQQSSFGGKCAFFWARICGYPHIILANIDLENEYVLDYAQRFMQKSKGD